MWGFLSLRILLEFLATSLNSLEIGRNGGLPVATMVVVVRTGAEVRPQSQCNVLRNGGSRGPHLLWGVPHLMSILPSVSMALKLNSSNYPHTP